MSCKIVEVGIGIDFGMTGSAITWKTVENPGIIHTICRWPSHGAGIRKVPTKVKIDSFENISWGFQCGDDNNHDTKQHFKVLLDPVEFNSLSRSTLCSQPSQSIDEVGWWSFLYLRCLMTYALATIGYEIQQNIEIDSTFFKLQIHCIFTTPSTWDTSVITTFNVIARSAVYDACQAPEARVYAPRLKTLRCDITEPDAVASYFLQCCPQLFKELDNFLVVDIGGGTSDPCFLRVANVSGHWVCKPEIPLRGLSEGAEDIDNGLRNYLKSQLQKARIPDSFTLAYRMSRLKYVQKFQEEYVGLMSQHERFGIVIPGCKKEFEHKDPDICDKKLIIDPNEIYGPFETRLKGILLNALKLFPNPPKYLVLAGGGGNRAYTKANLENIAPVIRVPQRDAVAFGSLQKWNEQLLLMTVIISDSPPESHTVGTSQRALGQEDLSHKWRKEAGGGIVTMSYTIQYPLIDEQHWESWQITADANEFPRLPCNFSEEWQNRTVEVVVILRLPKVSPCVLSEDFEAYTINGNQVPCEATVKRGLAYGDLFPKGP